MNTQEIVAPYFEQRPNRIARNLPFADYQSLSGVNSSLLREPTSYQMLERLRALAVLPTDQRVALEFAGADTSTIIERVDELTPRTTPRLFAELIKSPAPDEKPSPAQADLCLALANGPLDCREFAATALASCEKKGWIRRVAREVAEDSVSPQVKESRAQAFTLGRAVHTAILEPHFFDADKWHQHYQLSPSKGLTTKAALGALAAAPALELVTPEIIDTARRCRDAVWKHKEAERLLLEEGDSELSVEAWDEQAMCMRKARIDRLPKNREAGIVDVKTTKENLLEHPFRGTIYKNGYHQQAGFYLDTLALIEGKARPYFFIIAVTKEAPFISRVFEIAQPQPDNLVEKGRDIYLERLAKFSVAYHEGNWEAYENEGAVQLAA